MYEAHSATDGGQDDGAVLRAVPDLGGLVVEDATGISVGELFGALTEADTGLVRYIDLALTNLDRHVLVPIGHARVRVQDRGDARIRLRAALLEELEQIPPFPADVANIDDPFERSLLEAYGRSFHGERYYAHPSYDHQGLYAGEHPIVAGDDDSGDGGDSGGEARSDRHIGSGSAGYPGEQRDDDEAGHDRLRRLSYMPGWRVARGEPDIRGWPLLLDGGAELVVRDLIVEPAAEKVRYVATAALDGTAARLLPVGFLRVDAERQTVHGDGVTADDVHALPPWDGGGVSRDQEERVCAELRRRMTGRRRYNLPDFRCGHDELEQFRHAHTRRPARTRPPQE